MSKMGWVWIGFVFMLVVDAVIPWFALTHVQKMSGAFAFWLVWVVVAIAAAFVIVRNWREVK